MLYISEIKLPTDRVTLGDIRQREGLLVDRKLSDIRDAQRIERGLCERAIAGVPVDAFFPCRVARENITRAESIEALSEIYEQYGLSRGIHETEQLVREFEMQVRHLNRGASRG